MLNLKTHASSASDSYLASDINSALRDYMSRKEQRFEDTLRSVVREELLRYGKKVAK